MALLLYININIFYHVLKMFLFCFCLVSLSVQHNGGFLPDIILLTQCYMLLPLGNPFKCYEKVLYLQPMIPPKRFDIFPPDRGMLRRSRCVQIFLLKTEIIKTHLKRFRSDFYYRECAVLDQNYYLVVV